MEIDKEPGNIQPFDWMRQGNIFKYPTFLACPEGVMVVQQCHKCGKTFFFKYSTPHEPFDVPEYCFKHA